MKDRIISWNYLVNVMPAGKQGESRIKNTNKHGIGDLISKY